MTFFLKKYSFIPYSIFVLKDRQVILEIVISETSRPPIPNKNPLLRLKKIEPKNPSVDNKIQNRAKHKNFF